MVVHSTVLGPLMLLVFQIESLFFFGIDLTVKLFADCSVLYRKKCRPSRLLKTALDAFVVVQFFSWFKFYFPLFWGMVINS